MTRGSTGTAFSAEAMTDAVLAFYDDADHALAA
jgi:hypothetical protein